MAAFWFIPYISAALSQSPPLKLGKTPFRNKAFFESDNNRSDS